MLKVRIIPTLLWKDFGLVKGEGFDSWRRVGSVLPAIKVYNRRDVDELVLLDITATPEGNEPDVDSIQGFSTECMMPLTVGGGIKNIDQIMNVLITKKYFSFSICHIFLQIECDGFRYTKILHRIWHFKSCCFGHSKKMIRCYF